LLRALSQESAAADMSVVLVWLREGFRLDDQRPLLEAAQVARELIVVAFDDPGAAQASAWGHPRAGTGRQAFRRRSAMVLDAALEPFGQRLMWMRQDPVEGLVALVRRHRASLLWTHAQPGSEERETLERLSRSLPEGCTLKVAGDNRLLERTPFAVEDWPMSFSRFRRKIEGRVAPEPPLPPPTSLPPPPPPERLERCAAIEPNDRSDAGSLRGGEAAGRARLQHYLFDSDRVSIYKRTRDGLLAFDDSSKLSPWLAHGCLSARRIWAEIERYEREVEANESTGWLHFELLWREYFRWLMDATGSSLFRSAGVADRPPPSRPDAERLAAWREGRTGVPLVDAAMRELAATGYMSNRARQNVASFLVKDLRQDWRAGAAWFEHQLIDYDVASNWGNWAYQAGIGTDTRERWFNVVGQARRYDPDGAYLAHWLPELAALPAAARAAPWTQAVPPADYPGPIVIDPRWA